MGLGWFDCTEPPQSTYLEEKQGVQGVVQAHRTFLNHIIADIAKCVEFFNMGSGWFDSTEPPLSA